MPAPSMQPAPASSGQNVPAHVAVIMDGNGRWAKARGLPRVAGHKRGSDVLREVMEACRDAGVTHLTIYAFSAENWKRPLPEVSDLMELLRHYLKREIAVLHKNGVRLRVIGDVTRLAEDIRKQIDESEALTRGNTAFNLTVALSYGSRQELAQAARLLAGRVARGELKPEEIDENSFTPLLYTHDLPEPDLLIRTGGEHRLSNFLLWQAAYTELFFTPVLWPDFSAPLLREALAEFARRERRYGTTS